MKIFETPVLNIKEFNRVNILTASGDTPDTSKSAFEKAQAALQTVDQDITILNFVAS